MNKRTLLPLTLALVFTVAALPHASAVEAVTDPVGFITLSAKAGSVATPVISYIGLSMTQPIAYQSVVPSAGGQGAATVGNSTVITFPASTFTAGQFGPGAGAVPNYYLEIINGPSAGVMSEITNTATNAVTLYDNITAYFTNGTTTFRIRPHWTFGTAFGPTNATGFLGAATPADADIVSVVDPITGALTGFFYNTTSSRWEKTADNSDATNVPISPEAGLQLARKGNTDLTFKLAGAVKLGTTALYVEGAAADTFNMLVNPYPLDSVMLKDSGLYTGNNSTGLVGGTSATTADILRIHDYAHGQYNDFYYHTTEARWKTGFTDASLTVIPPGASLAVIRRANRSAFYWYDAQPTMVLGNTPLPLTLVSAVSRRTHTGFGDADINLPLSGVIGVENRFSGASGDYSVVFNFSGASTSNPITAASATMNGTGSIVGTPIFSGGSVMINLTGVANVQAIQVNLTGITATNGQTLSTAAATMGVLQGDIGGNKVVNAIDTAQAKSQALAALTLGNFRADSVITGSGSGVINATDTAFVKSKSLTSLP